MDQISSSGHTHKLPLTSLCIFGRPVIVWLYDCLSEVSSMRQVWFAAAVLLLIATVQLAVADIVAGGAGLAQPLASEAVQTAVNLQYSDRPLVNYKYVIVIDAGSSGSRLHVFRYSPEDLPIPQFKEVKNHKWQPGTFTVI